MASEARRAETPRLQDLYDRLAQIGLEGAAGRIYVHLYANGGAKAGELARDLGLSRGETYRLLKDLVDKEIVTSTLDRPIRFVAVAPDQLFDGLVDQARERLTTIERSRDEITHVLARLESKSEAAQGSPSFRMIHGRPAAAATWERLVRGARSSVLIVCVEPSGWSMVDALGWADLVAEAAARGAGAVVVGASGPDAPKLRKDGTERRLIDAAAAVVLGLVVDEREVLVWAVVDPSRRLNADGDIVLWSDSPDFVRAHAALFGALAGTGKLQEP